MKNINAVWMIFSFLLIRQLAMSQSYEPKGSLNFIKPYYLEIGFNKTSNIIFPYQIKSVDRGSQDILAQKAVGSNNILQLKAARRGFPETNISVVTDDDKLYSFIVNYKDNPQQLNREFVAPKSDGQVNQDLNAARFKHDAEKLLSGAKSMYRKRKQDQIVLCLQGLYAEPDAILLRLAVNNKSNIRYDIGSLRFTIKDKHQSKRTSVQERALLPLYRYRQSAFIEANKAITVIYALPKFSLSKQQYLEIELAEQRGGRNLQLKLPWKTLLKTRQIKD